MEDVEIDCPGKIFVGGLEIDVDQKVLENTFAKYGRITETLVIKDRVTSQSRGYGFVTFENPGDAEDAISGLNKKEVHGKEIHCEQATRKMSARSPRKRGPPPEGPRGGAPPPKRGMMSGGRRGRPPTRDGPGRRPSRDAAMGGPPPSRDGSFRGPPPSREGGSFRGGASRNGSFRGPPTSRDGPMMRGRPTREAGLDGGRPRESSFGIGRGSRGARAPNGRMGPPSRPGPGPSPRGRMSHSLPGRRSSMEGMSRRDDRMSFRDDRVMERESIRSRDSYLLAADSRDLVGRDGYMRDSGRDSLLDSRSYGPSRRGLSPEQKDYFDSRPSPRDRPTSRDVYLGREYGREMSGRGPMPSSRDFPRDDYLDGRDSYKGGISSRELSRDFGALSREFGGRRASADRRGPPPSREYDPYNPYNGDYDHAPPSRSHGSARDGGFSRGPPPRGSSPGARGPPPRSSRGSMSSRGPPPSRGAPSRGAPSRGPPPIRGPPSFGASRGPPRREDHGRGDMSGGGRRGRRPSDFEGRGPPVKRSRPEFAPRGGMRR